MEGGNRFSGDNPLDSDLIGDGNEKGTEFSILFDGTGGGESIKEAGNEESRKGTGKEEDRKGSCKEGITGTDIVNGFTFRLIVFDGGDSSSSLEDLVKFIKCFFIFLWGTTSSVLCNKVWLFLALSPRAFHPYFLPSSSIFSCGSFRKWAVRLEQFVGSKCCSAFSPRK